MTAQQVLRGRVRVMLVLLGLAVSSPAAGLPSGFQQVLVANGLSNPTAMQFAPDGRLFVCQQTGQLRVIKNGALLATPFLTVTVNSSGERGLLGVAFDPSFASNHFVYVYYTATTPAIHNRISRFTANGDVAVAGSEVVLFDLDNLSSATNHNGGALAFGHDGKLYAAVGENANGANAQTLNNVLGKMLRINSDGSIPTDNPFYVSASGQNRAIWALGLRNPFTFAFNPIGTELFINDVGQNTWEEIDNGIAGANYGWPDTEGATSDPRFVSPLYTYNHAGGECAITGGAFYAPLTTQFPADYVRDYFFADYCGGWIRTLDTSSGVVSTFATGLSFPVDLKVGDQGSLYVLARGSGAVYRIDYVSSEPVITSHPSSQTVPAGSPVTFSVRATSPSPLRYQWQRNAADIPGATAADYTIAAVGPADNGARVRAMVTNDVSSVLSNEAVLTVTGGGGGSQTLLTTQAPAVQDISNGRAYELGVRVMSDVAGQITAVRFWKGAGESGTHTGHVWTATGQLLATVIFTNESASGWQAQPLVPPVAMAANVEYVVSVSTPPNHLFVVTQNVFAAAPLINGHLRAPAGNNGVYGAIGAFPTGSYDSSNYFRDLTFVPGSGGGGDTTPPTVSITQPSGGTVGGMVTIAATSADNIGVAGLQFQVDGLNLGSEVPTPPSPSGISWDSTSVANGSHLLTAVVHDAAGNYTSASVTVTVANQLSSQTLLTTQTPALQDISNGRAYELGVRVLSDVAGQITALRFWKGANEGSTHTGHVWTATGQLLATVTFSNESASGWQQQSLATPVSVAANTEYVVSVTTPPNDLFVVTQNVFAATPLVNGHLRALAGNNGVFGPIGTFPAGSYDSSNYFRDLVFVPQ
jgi:glucose/arabinose dehydrogenase